MSMFDAFGPLDDLIQVIYQGTHRFVLLSKVDFDAAVPGWDVHLGLADAGRWWRGRWEEKDVVGFVGADVSETLLETFADNLAGTVTQGDLFIGDWSAEKGADIKIIFGPSGKKPLPIPLTELSAEEAAIFVANELFSLGLNAQQRKCRLNPPAIPVYSSIPAAPAAPRRNSPPPTKKPRRASPSPPPPSSYKPKEANTPRRIPKETRNPPPEPRPAKPKSKGGVIKKGRKVQDMEFASDDE
ncbi:hypothetical protein DFH11DRAFT_458918 [Phellopilus nigrolimitatus]|nr:hypothetical protein DFH11DRAFT_458918 [Phellopilus nigrolimitatus]